jgi:hypothetical protein
MNIKRRFVVLVIFVSALLLLSVLLVSDGIGGAGMLAVLAGSLLGAAGLLGLVVLGRIVVVLERARSIR